MNTDRANLAAAQASADETIQRLHQLATVPSPLVPGTTNAEDFESRLRSLILSNGIAPTAQEVTDIGSGPATKSPELSPLLLTAQQGSDVVSGLATTRPEPSAALLPPHMRLATPAQQQEYLDKVKEITNASNAPPPSTRIKPPVQAPRKKPNQAQRRQLKSQFEMQISQSPTTNISSGTFPNSMGAPYQTRDSINQQAPSNQQQARPPQLQARPTQQQFRAPSEQGGRATQPTVAPQLQIFPAQRQNRLSYQPAQVPQQPPVNSDTVGNRPVPITFNNTHASSVFPLPHGHQTRRFGNPHQQHPGLISHGHFARPAPQNHQLYQPHRSGQFGHPQQQIPIHNPPTQLAIQAQVDYLNQRAEVEIAEAEMDVESLREKETLRLLLQRLCRSAIRNYEQKKSRIFDEGSVSLQSFGSLRSGFATRGSDMDLALVSPFSDPDIASPDSEIPRLLEKTFLDLGYGARLLTRTRVPIIKFCEKPTPELADALRKARTEWEEERDAPPKPVMVEPEKVKGNQSQLKVNKSGEHMALKHGGVIIVGDVIDRVPESEIPQTVSIPEQPAGEVSIGEGRATKVDTTDIDKNADSKSKEHAIEHQKTQIVSHVVTQEGKVEVQGSSEEELPHRSDEELVRMYQLAISEGWFSEEERKQVLQFSSAVERHGSDGDHPEVVAARLHLETLSYVLKRYRAPPDTRLDFPKGGIGIQCDINFSNHLALHNTLLLRCYNHCDLRVRPTVLFVKAWAKRRKINSPYHGTLSSYGYVLMALHYLVNIAQPPLVPNLQMAWKPPRHGPAPLNETTVDGYDVRFWRSEREILDLAHRGMLGQNCESIGSLLRGFFHYFAHIGPNAPQNGFSWTQEVLSLRTPGGRLTKQEKGWTGAKTTIIEPTAAGQQGREIKHRYLFAIEDPFEIDHNIARTVVHDGIVAIRDEFRRAHRIIQSSGRTDMGPMEDLFAEGRERETRPRKSFGPLPPPPPAPKEEPVNSAGSAPA